MDTRQTATPESPKKRKTVWGTIGKILMYGWMFILIGIFGIIILISSLCKGGG